MTFGEGHGFLSSGTDIIRQQGKLPHHLDADLVELDQITRTLGDYASMLKPLGAEELQAFLGKVHQRIHLLGRTIEVVDTKGVGSHGFDAQIHTRLKDLSS